MSSKSLLMIIALAAAGTACRIVESSPGQAITAPTAIESETPTLDLRRAPIEEPSLLDDYSPNGFQVFPGSRGRVVAPDGEVILTGTQERPIFSVRRAPGNGDLLVHFGSGNYSIYSLSGTVTADVPAVQSHFEDASAAVWRWKDSRSLVGTTEISTPTERRMYPDGDALPDSTLLLLYEPYEAPEKVYLLNAPESAAGTVVRLEGVAENGMLLLSIVEPQQYFGGPPREILGVFEVERP